LAAGHDWVKAFAKEANKVYVYSTHVGLVNLPSNVVVKELGGGGRIERIKWVINVTRSILDHVSCKTDKIVFHHMSQYTAIYPGIIYRIISAKQGLWYAHAHKSKTLVIASHIVKNLFSSAPGAMPLEKKMVHYVGQGVNMNRFKVEIYENSNRENSIVSLGRVSASKNLDVLLEILPPQYKNHLVFAGPQNEKSVCESLIRTANEKKLKLNITKTINYEDVPLFLSRFKFYYCGTKVAVDKAVIEAAMCGCLIITSNLNVLALTGMNKVYDELRIKPPDSVLEQLRILDSIDENKLKILRDILRSEAGRSNDVNNTIKSIIRKIQGS
jgi:glycosyltransferase involved in cell wall biosynthesis